MTDVSIIFIKIMSVGELSVDEMSCRRNVRVVHEMFIGEMSVGEMFVGEMSSLQNVCL